MKKCIDFFEDIFAVGNILRRTVAMKRALSHNSFYFLACILILYNVKLSDFKKKKKVFFFS